MFMGESVSERERTHGQSFARKSARARESERARETERARERESERARERTTVISRSLMDT